MASENRERSRKMKLRVLMIGNSFSVCVGKNLPQIVRSAKKHQLKLTSAFIGGCSLERHAANLCTASADPAFAPYRIDIWDSADLRKHSRYYGNVLELLRNNQYDLVTIQQASPKSWDFSTYYPYAAVIIDCIKKYNPNARIMIQQTWSYRSDSPRLAEWGFDNTEMHERLVKAYDAFAAETGFELIPSGEAIRIFRLESGLSYRVPSKSELENLHSPDLPPMAGDVVGRDYWRKDENGELVLAKDTIHLNFRGEYLQSCVWYGKLFGEDPRSIDFEPRNISRSECQLMRACAREALTLD